ncbi:unnamed protein product, partial [Amoebophrya sp. A120]
RDHDHVEDEKDRTDIAALSSSSGQPHQRREQEIDGDNGSTMSRKNVKTLSLGTTEQRPLVIEQDDVTQLRSPKARRTEPQKRDHADFMQVDAPPGPRPKEEQQQHQKEAHATRSARRRGSTPSASRQ